MELEIGENLMAVFPWLVGGAVVLGVLAVVVVCEVLGRARMLADALCMVIEVWRGR